MEIAALCLTLAIIIACSVNVYLGKQFLQWLAHVIQLGRDKK